MEKEMLMKRKIKIEIDQNSLQTMFAVSLLNGVNGSKYHFWIGVKS